jgi:quercetin dioxygenase-like cupin family protein
VGDSVMRPYALKAGEGWTYDYGIDFTVKAGELGQGRRLAVVEYTTRSGEEPPDHTHATEDEVFYVLEGEVTFRCGEDVFEVSGGGFVYLPRGIPHGYTIGGEGDTRLLVMTAPVADGAPGGWGGFVAGFEAEGELRASPPGLGRAAGGSGLDDEPPSGTGTA